MRAYIIKVQSPNRSGYLKAIRDTGFSLTKDIKSAKKYDANESNILDYIMYDIDLISRFDYNAICEYDKISSGISISNNAVLEETVWFQASKKHIPYCVGCIVERNRKKYFLDNFGTEMLLKANGIRLDQHKNCCLLCQLGNEVAEPVLITTTKYDKEGMTGELKAKLYARDKRYTFVERSKVKEFIQNM